MILANLAHLDDAIAQASPADLPAVVGALERLKALAWARLAMPVISGNAEPDTPSAGDWLSPDDAARIAGLDVHDDEAKRRAVRRIYGWAKGQKWAARPTRKCLRISERGFRRWLSLRT